MEFFKFYVSNFWIWAGITFGIFIISSVVISLIKEFFKFLAILVRGYQVQEIKEKTNEEIGKDLAEKIINKTKKNNDYKIEKTAKATVAGLGVKNNG